MKIVLLGPPGSGKGTQSKFLVNEQNFIQLSTGDLLREKVAKKDSSLGQEINVIMNNGDLVPDNIVIQLIVEKISELRKSNLIFDGFPLILIGGFPSVESH